MIWKPQLVISCPASSRSGYGDHARDIVRSLINLQKFDVKVLDQPWGNCPRTELKSHPDISKLVISNMTAQPDVFIQVTVPNEFQKVGKYNIGITAGIETDRCAPEWIQGCNNMDLVIVPSEHAKNVFMNTIYNGKDQNNQPIELKLETPIEVVLEGLDLNVFKKTTASTKTVDDLMSTVESDFAFLFVGHWLKGNFGHDRKDVAGLIQTFHNTFKNKSKKNQPALILKTGMAGFSRVDEHALRSRILQLTGSEGPEIKIVHGELTPQDMNALYNHKKVKAMVSFTKGEGFGRPLLEFGVTGKPIIATNWSGHIDFLKHATLLPGKLQPVDKSAQWDKVIIDGSQWFYVDYNAATSYFKAIYKDYKVFCEDSRKQPQHIKKNFSLEKADEIYASVFEQYVPDFPEPVQLKLPELTLPTLEKTT